MLYCCWFYQLPKVDMFSKHDLRNPSDRRHSDQNSDCVHNVNGTALRNHQIADFLFDAGVVDAVDGGAGGCLREIVAFW